MRAFGSVESEYEWAAEWVAKKGLKGKIGDPLPELLSGECAAMINDDLDAFERRVTDFGYMAAMESTEQRNPPIGGK